MERKVIILEQKNTAPFLNGYLKMKIALCDWDIVFLEKIKKAIYAYADLFRIDIVADCYNSGEKLLNSGINYNIIFLGYRLCGINGLETAKAIRKNETLTTIVFISEITDFVFEAFKVSPFRFLVKPINTNSVVKVIEDYFEKYGTDYQLLIKSGDDTLCLNTGQIYYLEANNKHCYVHLKEAVLPCNRTMAKVFNRLPKNHFSKINRAYIVNLNLINKYNNETVYLKNGDALRISRNYIKCFKDDYRRLIEPKEL